MDAAENVAGLTVAACRQISSDPSGERVVDPLDGAVLVEQEDADVGDVEDGLKLRVGGLQLTGALLNQFLQVMPVLLPSSASACLRSVTSMPISRMRRRTVGVGEGEVGDVIIAAVRAGPFPAMRRLGFQDRERFASLAGLAASEQILITAPALRLAEAFLEEAIGKGDVIVGRQQHDVGGQHVQHVAEPLPFGFQGRDGLLRLALRPAFCSVTSRAAAKTPCTSPASFLYTTAL